MIFSSRGSDSIVQSWYVASNVGEFSDYSVCTTWFIRGDNFYLMNLLRAKLAYPELIDCCIS